MIRLKKTKKILIRLLCLSACIAGTVPLEAQAGGDCIKLFKQISIDGGTTFADADTESDAAKGAPPINALYRLIVKNCGTSDLDWVKVNDPTLYIPETLIPSDGMGSFMPVNKSRLPPLPQTLRS